MIAVPNTRTMSPSARSTRHRWHLNYTDDSTNVSLPPQPQRTPAIRAAVEKHTSPPGFPPEVSARDPSILQGMASRKEAQSDSTTPSAAHEALAAGYQSSWAAAFSPIRNLLTSAFALFMTGSSIQFFSVATTVTVLFMHLQKMFSVREAFRPALKAGVPAKTLVPQAVVYVFLMSVGVALGLYKAHMLGFLPTTQSDWVSLLPLRVIGDGYLREGYFLRS